MYVQGGRPYLLYTSLKILSIYNKLKPKHIMKILIEMKEVIIYRVSITTSVLKLRSSVTKIRKIRFVIIIYFMLFYCVGCFSSHFIKLIYTV